MAEGFAQVGRKKVAEVNFLILLAVIASTHYK